MTVTIFTSASEAKTGGYTFSILQFEASSFFNSEIDLTSFSKQITLLYGKYSPTNYNLPFYSVKTDDCSMQAYE